MGAPIVSVIVPVYNVECYLHQCVDSLLEQTYQALDIVLVDDGSTDTSGKICDVYAERDSRVRTIHKTNGGGASARECGISQAIGEYIMMVDGDDWLHSDTIEQCVAIAKRYNVDCVLFTYVKEYPKASVPVQIMGQYGIIRGEEAEQKVYRRLFGLLGEELDNPARMDSIVSCCMKLYKINLAKEGRYFDVKLVGSSEDALFNMYALNGCKNFYYLNQPFYHYRKNDKSITNTYRPQLVEQWNTLFEIIAEIIKEKELSEEYVDALHNRIALSIVGIGMNELANKKQSCWEHIINIRKYLSSESYQKACKDFPLNKLPFVWKIFMFCSKRRLAIGVYLQLIAMNYLKKKM